MPEEQPQDQISFLLSDFNARLRDTEEKNRVLKERIVILGNNILTLKDNLDNSLAGLKKDVSSLKKDVENIKSLLENFVNESNSFVRKDEVALIERMLKDFYPLEFAREKDMRDLVEERINELKENLSKKEDRIDEEKIKRRLEEEKIEINKRIHETISKAKEEIRREFEESKSTKQIKPILEEKQEAKVETAKEKPTIEHKILSSNINSKSEENKKLHEHINHVISHLAQAKTHPPNKSKKGKNLR